MDLMLATPKSIEKELARIQTQRALFERALERKKPETVRAYLQGVKHFANHIKLKESRPTTMVEHFIDIGRLASQLLVEDYLKWMEQEQRLSSATINQRLAAIKFFVRVAKKVDWCSWELMVESVPSDDPDEVHTPNAEEFQRILAVVDAKKSITSKRNKVILMMMAYMGLRISSVLSLNVENIDFRKKSVLVYWKGGKVKRRPVPEQTFQSLIEWLDERQEHVDAELETSGPVFINFDRDRKSARKTKDRRLTRSTIDKWLKKVGKKADISWPLHCHCFRHFMASEIMEHSGDRDMARATGGWSSDRLVDRYDADRREVARRGAQLVEDRWSATADIEPFFGDDLFEEVEDDDDPQDDMFTSQEDRDSGPVGAGRAMRNAQKFNYKPTGFAEFDKVIGGGLVQGGLYLLFGPPGIGKSTLARQIGGNMHVKLKTLCASAEETEEQIGASMQRLNLDIDDELYLLWSCSEIEKICLTAHDQNVRLLIGDSVNTFTSKTSKGQAGGVSQLRAVTNRLRVWAKKTNTTVILIGHVTKDGSLAGPETLKHEVDCVIEFLGNEEDQHRTIFVRGKNRFGKTNQKCYMEMREEGLFEVVEGPLVDDEGDL